MGNDSSTLVHLTIDGNPVSVPKGTTVYKAAQLLNIDIPVFCYLDRMPPFGACRMCLVEVEKFPKLQASCTLEATEGMVIKTQSQMALEGREGVLELLLINHPLDCPICDRGGECPLQDHTMQCGPGKSRFYEEKRHFKKHLALGPVLTLDRERCIVCARCTRFGELVSGDHALQFIERGFRTEVGTPDGRPVESKFIGNTIKICPVGALTSSVYRFRARPWDNLNTESTCTLCPVGCNLTFSSRDGEITRTLSSENPAVNDIWLCDKGWFGYEFANHDQRLQTPLIRRNGILQEATWDEALSLVAEKFRTAKESGNGKLAGFGGTPLTVEENHLFQKLFREFAGVNHVDYRIGCSLPASDAEIFAPGMQTPIQELEHLDFAILLGLDLTEEFPLLWLRLKQAINKGAKVLFLGHFSPEIASQIHQTIVHPAGQELASLHKHFPELTKLVSSGAKGTIFVGRQYLNTPDRAPILHTLQSFLPMHSKLSLNIMEGSGNSMGARFAGMHPHYGPMGKPLSKPGLNWIKVLETARDSGWDFLYLAGSNVIEKCSKSLWNNARAHLGFLVVQDLFLTETAQQADVVLPTLCYAEKSGSFINIEGRVQRLQPGKAVPPDLFSDGEIFLSLAQRLKFPLQLDANLQNTLTSGKVSLPQLSSTSPATSTPFENVPDALRASFSPALFDRGERMKRNHHLLELAKTPYVRIHSNEASKRSLQDLQQVRLSALGNSIEGTLKIDDTVADDTVIIPIGFDQLPTQEWGGYLLNGLPIRISPL